MSPSLRKLTLDRTSPASHHPHLSSRWLNTSQGLSTISACFLSSGFNLDSPQRSSDALPWTETTLSHIPKSPGLSPALVLLDYSAATQLSPLLPRFSWHCSLPVPLLPSQSPLPDLCSGPSHRWSPRLPPGPPSLLLPSNATAHLISSTNVTLRCTDPASSPSLTSPAPSWTSQTSPIKNNSSSQLPCYGEGTPILPITQTHKLTVIPAFSPQSIPYTHSAAKEGHCCLHMSPLCPHTAPAWFRPSVPIDGAV